MFPLLICCSIKSFLAYYDWNNNELSDENSDCEYFV